MTHEIEAVQEAAPEAVTEQTEQREQLTMDTIKGKMFQTIDAAGNIVNVKAEQLLNLVVRYVRQTEIATEDKSLQMIIGDALSLYPELYQLAMENRPFIGFYQPDQAS